MRSLATVLLGVLAFVCPTSTTSAEYGGRWTDESIREYSLKYIEATKERFANRAARIADITES